MSSKIANACDALNVNQPILSRDLKLKAIFAAVATNISVKTVTKLLIDAVALIKAFHREIVITIILHNLQPPEFQPTSKRCLIRLLALTDKIDDFICLILLIFLISRILSAPCDEAASHSNCFLPSAKAASPLRKHILSCL